MNLNPAQRLDIKNPEFLKIMLRNDVVTEVHGKFMFSNASRLIMSHLLDLHKLVQSGFFESMALARQKFAKK
jgi:hypothetical protein